MPLPVLICAMPGSLLTASTMLVAAAMRRSLRSMTAAGIDMSSILTAPVGPVTTTCLSSMWRKNTSVESSSATSCAAIVPAHASSRIERYDFIL